VTIKIKMEKRAIVMGAITINNKRAFLLFTVDVVGQIGNAKMETLAHSLLLPYRVTTLPLRK